MKQQMQRARAKAVIAGLLAVVMVVSVESWQEGSPKNAPTQKIFRGCLQGDATKGFSLLAATGDGSDTKGQTMTYRVVSAVRALDFAKMVNRVVEIRGTLATDPASTGQIPAPITDSTRGTAGAGGTGKPGENTAFYFANGTLTAQSVRQVAATCAARSAPDGK